MLTLTPQLIDFTVCESRTLAGGIRYLRFDEFDRASLHWLSTRLKSDPPPAGVIVDLRSNLGGDVLALSVAIAEFFPGRVTEGRQITRRGFAREDHSLPWLSARYAGPVVILIGPGTASAAEIFSHVLQFHHRARLIGRRTAGAVIISRLYGLPGGGQLQVPVTDYVGLDGQRLEGRGVTPDVVLPLPDISDLRTGRDPDLEAARHLLKNP
jgi:carboxyl-terminal processing protease